MGWIGDVAPYDTATSLWANTVTDRIVQTFTSKAERDAHTADLPVGSVAHCADINIVYLKVSTGAWWVLAMPWRPYTVAAWGLVGTPTPLTIISGGGQWRQSMGAAQAVATYQADMGSLFNVNANVIAGTPTPMTTTGVAGIAKVYPNFNALNYGGWAGYYNASGVIIGNVGNGVPPNATINVPSGNTYITIDVDLAYPCNPTADTP